MLNHKTIRRILLFLNLHLLYTTTIFSTLMTRSRQLRNSRKTSSDIGFLPSRPIFVKPRTHTFWTLSSPASPKRISTPKSETDTLLSTRNAKLTMKKIVKKTTILEENVPMVPSQEHLLSTVSTATKFLPRIKTAYSR